MPKSNFEGNTSARRKVLVLGGSGFIGRHLLMAWGDLAIGTHKNTVQKDTVYFDPLSMDLTSITDVDECSHAVILYGEREPDTCFMQPEMARVLNVESTKRMIGQCQALGIVPVFASTEMVFSGAKGMYEESDIPDPILLYGKFKVEVEEYLIRNLDNYIIFRLSKVMGVTRNDRSIFANWLTQLETNSTGKIKCARDQFLSLIAVSDVARLLFSLIKQDVTGIFHFSDGLRHNRLELLKLFLNEYQKATKLEFTIEPVSINDFGSLEVRPLDLSLSSKKLAFVNTSGFATPLSQIQQLIR